MSAKGEERRDLVDELVADGMTPEAAAAAVKVMAEWLGPTDDLHSSALPGRELDALEDRILAGTSTNDDAAKLAVEVRRLQRVIHEAANRGKHAK